MAKKYRSGVYLGETRRQRTARIRTFAAATALVLITVLCSVFFVAWLLDRADAPPAVPQDPADEITTDRAADTADPLPQLPEETQAQTSAAEPTPDGTPEPVVPLVGEAYKPLDYTGTWSVMLDPGHGFDDIGASSALLGEVNEATINLDIALRVREILAAHDSISVIMTHEDNAVDGRISASDGGEPPLNNLVLLTPEDRAVLANGQDIDLFVSIHCDSLPSDPGVSGMRVYYYRDAAVEGPLNGGREALAAHVANQFGLRMGDSAPTPLVRNMTEDTAFYVIKKLHVPSVLCEVGFVTNEQDAADLLDAEWRRAAAEGIAKGILCYIDSSTK